MQATNLLVSSRRHPLCRVNSSIKTRDTHLSPTPSLTPIAQASAASIQNLFALSGTLYVRLSSPSQASPFRLVRCCCVQVYWAPRREDSLRHVRWWLDLHRGPQALTRDKGSQTRWRDHPQAKWMYAWRQVWRSRHTLLESFPSYLIALTACTMPPVSESSVSVAVQLVCCAV